MGCGDGYRRYPPGPDPARRQGPRTPGTTVVSSGSLSAWLGDTASRDALLAAWHAAPEPAAGRLRDRARWPSRPAQARPGHRSRSAHPAGAAACRCLPPSTPQRCGCRAFPRRFPAGIPARSRSSPPRWCGAPSWPTLTLQASRSALRCTRSGCAPTGWWRRCRPGNPHSRIPGICSCSSARPRDGRYPTVPPTLAVIDAADEPWQFAADAAAWAEACGAIPVMFADIARRTWLGDCGHLPVRLVADPRGQPR